MIFKMLVDNEKSQIDVLKALHEVWKNHQQVYITYSFIIILNLNLSLKYEIKKDDCCNGR
jgi:hypothetical protein